MNDVYLLYDRRGNLLYVGSSAQSGLTRAKQHRSYKPWGSKIYRVVFRAYGSFKKACAVEARAIALLDPIHNVNSVRRSAPYKPTPDQFHRHRAIWLDPLGGTYESKRKQISADYGSELTRGILNGRFGWLDAEKPIPPDMDKEGQSDGNL